MNEKLKGLGVAVVTPFLQNGEIDVPSLEKLVENLIGNGIDYLVALGTTSETPTLSEEEKARVLQIIINTASGRVPVVMGLGGPCTRKIIDYLAQADLTGISAILSVSPYYNRPSQEGIYEHYSEIAYHSPLPIILYNVGVRTACNIEATTTLRLAHDCEKIIGIKEASGNMNQIMHLIKHKPDHFLVISGDDAVALPLMATGIDGLISVLANAFPRQMATIIHQAAAGNFAEARSSHLKMLDIIQACFKEGNPAGIKAVLSLQGKIDYYLRLPLTRVSLELQNEYKELLKNID